MNILPKFQVPAVPPVADIRVALAHDLASRLLEQGAAFERGVPVAPAVLDALGIAPDRFNGLLDRADWVLSQARAY